MFSMVWPFSFVSFIIAVPSFLFIYFILYFFFVFFFFFFFWLALLDSTSVLVLYDSVILAVTPHGFLIRFLTCPTYVFNWVSRPLGLLLSPYRSIVPSVLSVALIEKRVYQIGLLAPCSVLRKSGRYSCSSAL